MRIDIVVYDGFDELDALGPLEVLRSAADLGADLSARLVTRTDQPVATGSHGARVGVDGVFDPGVDLVVVSGGRWVARGDVGAWGEVQRGDWLPLLAEAAGRGALMASVCTGALLLAHAGVVGHRRATTHRAAWADLEATGATVVGDRVVDDGDLVTCGGVTSGIDLALWLVERLASAEVAGAVATTLEYEPVRPGGALTVGPVPAIRQAEPDELDQLVAIEAAADRLFATIGFDLVPGPRSLDGLRRARAVLVAGRPPVGFAAMEEVDGTAHLEQLAVHPDHGRRGIGRALLEAACGWAAAAGYPTVTLVTFADVAWNGPFYARAGFGPATELGPGLAELRATDRRNGLDELGRRQVMVRALASDQSR